MREETGYNDWKKEVEIWSDFTDLKAEQQGGALFLTLTGKARQVVLDGVSRADMKLATGLVSVLTSLDSLYLKDESQCAFSAFEDFTNYRRSHELPIETYLVEFNLKYSKVKSYNMTLPDGVVAFYLLTCANLSEEKADLCRATAELTYVSMRKQIEKVTTPTGTAKTNANTTTIIQPQFYANYEDYQNYEDFYEYNGDEGVEDALYANEGPNQYQDNFFSRPGFNWSQNRPGRPKTNPPDETGNPSRCTFCRSIYHWVGECPDAPRTGFRGRSRPYRRSIRGGRNMRGNRGGNF